MTDIPNDVKRAILAQELGGVEQQIYRLSVSSEARKLAGYTEQENAPLVTELERLVRMRDVLTAKSAELQ